MAIGTAAAIIGGSLIAGGASALASKKAAQAQQRAASETVAEQQRQFDITQESLRPFQEAGVSALEQQQALLGLSGPEEQQQAVTGMAISPGQQFLQQRAQKNLLRNAAAVGGLGGGNVRSALVQQGVGFAQQDLQNQFSRLGQLAGQGQAAATDIGQFGQAAAGQVGQALQTGGQARASGILGAGQAFQQGLSGALTGLAQGGMLTPSTGTTLPAQNINPFARIT